MKRRILRPVLFLCAFLVATGAPAQKPAKRLPERTPVRAPAIPDTAAVRAALNGWYRAYQQKDLDRFLSFYSEHFRIDGVESSLEERRAYARWNFDNPEQALVYGIGGARLTVHDTLAFAEPVTVLSEWRFTSLRLVFRKEPVGWRIYSQEVISTGPPELGMFGLGQDYVALLERWASADLTWARQSLWANPPNGGSRRLRRDALLRLDEPLHLLSAPRLRPIQDFLTSDIDSALAQVRTERVTEGATVWKLYNHGWVIRTPNHTWAHDFYEGQEPAVMSNAQIEGILDQVEALFVSHWHLDHASRAVMKRAIAKGIPVLAAPLPSDSEWLAELRRQFGDSTGSLRGITLVEPGSDGEVAGIHYHAYPGHQGDLTNNVYAVTADGMTFMQTGDQSNRADFAWIDRVGDERSVDVLLPNVWTDDLPRMIRGVRPRVVIPGHENELGHNFEHREPYAQAFEKLEEEKGVEWYVLAWGERMHVPPR